MKLVAGKSMAENGPVAPAAFGDEVMVRVPRRELEAFTQAFSALASAMGFRLMPKTLQPEIERHLGPRKKTEKHKPQTKKRGCLEAAILQAFRQANRSMGAEVVLRLLRKDASVAGMKSLNTVQAISVALHQMMKKGMLERVSRGEYGLPGKGPR